MNISLDGLLSGLISGVLVLLGTVAFGARQARRAERLAVAERLHPRIQAMALNPSPYVDGGAERDLRALISLQPWLWERMRAQRLVRQYLQAQQQQTESDSLGQVHYTDPAEVAAAAQALLPFVEHR